MSLIHESCLMSPVSYIWGDKRHDSHAHASVGPSLTMLQVFTPIYICTYAAYKNMKYTHERNTHIDRKSTCFG